MGCYYFSGVVILVFISFLHSGSCMECKLGHESTFIEKLDFVNPKQCPTILDSNDKQYCCVRDERVYCCDAAEFLGTGAIGIKIDDDMEVRFGVLLPVLIAVAIGFFIVCCLCCLCCPCCLLYKRRHRGTVYGNVLQPGVQTTIMTVQPPAPPQQSQQQAPVYPPQPTMPMPGYSQPGAYPVYPPQPGQQPPPYSEALVQEAYTKQSPYNPNYQ